ncbi:TPA: copper uptake system-associated protein [Pseudomonas aeruginosa]
MHPKHWLALLCILVAAPLLAAEPDARQSIVHLMKHTWERPDAPLQIEPVTVRGDFAVAGWAQGERGGRALLRRVDGQWQVVLCAGDALRAPDVLRDAGLSDQQAQQMSLAVAQAESDLPEARLRQLSSFEGVQRMDAQHGKGATSNH